MSLQVWLPLNGNLNNQGLDSSLEFTNTASATVATDGKLGSCYSFSATSGNGLLLSSGKSASEFMDAYINHRSWSLCAWVKTTSDSSIVFGLTYGLRFFCGSTNIVRLGDNEGDVEASNSISTADGKWHHICATYDTTDNAVNVYVDGVKGTTTYYPSGSTYASPWTSAVAIGRNFNDTAASPAFYFQGSMNDARIYDHCLSAKEVKEISKGLICHYKLDNNGFGNPNLITTMSPGGRTTLNGKYGLNADFSQNTDTYGYFNVSPALELDTTYTLSFDVSNFPKGGSWNFMLWNNANYEVGTITKDGHYTYTFVPSESKLPSDYNLTKFLFDDGSRTNPSGVVHFTNFKIEKGNKATPWCPHTSDSLYASLGLDSTTESDCSGYNNNGTISGSGSCESNSPRYSCSFTTNSAGRISSSNGFPVGTHPVFTVNFWLKSNEGTFSQWGDVLSIQGNHQIRLEAVYASGSTFEWFNYPLGTLGGFGEFNVSKNVWYMITLVSDGSKFYCYKDASLYNTTSFTGTEWTTNGAFTIGDSSGMYVSISDVRIYSTALSDSDIKELYNISASVDKNGNMYAYEFKEE